MANENVTPNTQGLILWARQELEAARKRAETDQASGGRAPAPDDLRKKIQPTVKFETEESSR